MKYLYTLCSFLIFTIAVQAQNKNWSIYTSVEEGIHVSRCKKKNLKTENLKKKKHSKNLSRRPAKRSWNFKTSGIQTLWMLPA